MIRVEPHVPMLDQLLAVYAADGHLKPIEVSAAILQGARSEGVSFYDDTRPPSGDPSRTALADGSQRGDHLIACGLLYPLSQTTYELVFACRPEASRHMLAIVRAARLTLARLPDDVVIRALCRRDNIAGRRLACMIGLRPAGRVNDFKRYVSHGKIRRRHQDAVHRPRHLQAGRRDRATA